MNLFRLLTAACQSLCLVQRCAASHQRAPKGLSTVGKDTVPAGGKACSTGWVNCWHSNNGSGAFLGINLMWILKKKILSGFFTILQLQYLRTESGWVGEFLAGSRTRGRLNLLLLLLTIGLLSSQEFYLLGRPSTSMSAIMRPQTSFTRWWRPFSLKPSHSSSLPSSLDYRRVPNLPAIKKKKMNLLSLSYLCTCRPCKIEYYTFLTGLWIQIRIQYADPDPGG